MKRIRVFGYAMGCLLAGCHGAPPAASIERGHHLATVMGCTSCHGKRLDGHLFEEDPKVVLAWSSNLSRVLPRWSDREIEAALRTGKRPDGSALWFMPTFAQAHLTREDMAALIAWLRTVPATGVDHPPMKTGPVFAQMVAAGFTDSAAQAGRVAARTPLDAGPDHAKGRYLASIACAECHGPDLTGARDPRPGDPPDLTVAAAYTPAAFARLLEVGVRQDGHPANEMREEAPKRLSALDATEVSAIRAYLLARAAMLTSAPAGSRRPDARR
jgi:cytochrome c553